MFGSFASVIIYRIRSQEGGMWTGRSHCKTCERDLSALELVPIFSWLFQWGKCKWCKSHISAIYPLLEVVMWILFIAVGYFLIDKNLIFNGSIFEWSRMIFFVSIMFFTVIYVFYDILYMEIPESSVFIANILALWALLFQWYWYPIIPYLTAGGIDIWTIVICLWVLALLYYIMLAGLSELHDCLLVLWCIILLWGYMTLSGSSYSDSALLSGTIAALWVFISFFLQILLSGGKAMWQWDLRIGILMWLLTWVSLAFPAWMICYIIGSIVWIFLILRFKIKNGRKSTFDHHIPFGPFIASGYIWVLLFAPQIQSVLQWYL